MNWQNNPVTLRLRVAGTVLVAALALPLHPASAALPDYKLGDEAAEDIVTPVPLLVVNPEATEALRRRVAGPFFFVVRQSSQTAVEVETELRQSIATARSNFLLALQQALQGRSFVEAKVDSPVFLAAVGEAARQSPPELPLDQLARLWIRGASDESLVESLLQPLREVMAQPVVGSGMDSAVPANQPVRLMMVKNLSGPPTAPEIESAGPPISPEKIISLERARRLVETHFPAGQEQLGRFAGSFVRDNAVPDPGLTGILQARKVDGVTANDTYEPAQVIIHKGQTIDRKALSALAAMREKSLIGALQTKLEHEQSVAGQITKQTNWIAASLGAVVVALGLILWRLRARPSTALVAVPADPATGDWDPTALPEGADEGLWQQRAIEAEDRAERAHEAIRSGVLGWMREKIFRTLSRQRAELLSAQQKAEAEVCELEQRLEQVHTPLQDRINAYESRIEELEKDLAAKGEENRQLIGARISVAKQQLSLERRRERFGTN